jgi:hypothetical protein
MYEVRLRGPAALGVFIVATIASSCDLQRTEEPRVAASVGITQLAEADGALIDEESACQSLRDALLSARESNGCHDLDVLKCPQLIRPGGSLACRRFVEESLEACAEEIRHYNDCHRLEQPACVVVAVTDATSEGCIAPMAWTDADAGAAEERLADGGSPQGGAVRDARAEDAGAGPGDAPGPRDAQSGTPREPAAGPSEAGTPGSLEAGMATEPAARDAGIRSSLDPDEVSGAADSGVDGSQ